MRALRRQIARSHRHWAPLERMRASSTRLQRPEPGTSPTKNKGIPPVVYRALPRRIQSLAKELATARWRLGGPARTGRSVRIGRPTTWRVVGTARILTITARLLRGLLAKLAAALARFLGVFVAAVFFFVLARRHRVVPVIRLCARRRRIRGRRRQLYPPRDVLGTHGVLGQQPDGDVEVRVARWLRVRRNATRHCERDANRACDQCHIHV